MQKPDFTSIVIASTLAAFLVVPSLADDMQNAQPGNEGTSQTMPASMDPGYGMGNRHENRREAALDGDTTIPHARNAGSVRYITGGIGDEERDTLDGVKGQYNLHITSTNMQGEFNGDTQISVIDGKGQPLLSVPDAGPLFYAALPPGTYTVQASNSGSSKSQKVSVAPGKSSSLYFRW